jgi:hypothetical protein
MASVEYRWQQPFLSVLTEVDTEKFAVRLAIADDALFNRLLELEGTSAHNEERLALEDTMQDLRLLRSHSYYYRV